MPKLIDLIGLKFSRLTVIDKHPDTTRTRYNCKCECGNDVIVRACSLKEGRTKSCGCLHQEWAKSSEWSQVCIDHGASGTPEYKAWREAKRRCLDPKSRGWHGRGIQFKIPSFQDFLDHVGPRPSPKHSIDRIDNNGHYEIGNIKWSTAKEQAANRRNSISNLSVQLMRAHIAFGANLAQTAKLFGISKGYLYRIVKGDVRREAGGYLNGE